MTQILSTALANSLATIVTSTFNVGRLEIYSGHVGSTPEDVSGGTLLLSIVLPLAAFGTASNASVSMAGQWFGTVSASGTAAWGRLCDPTNTLHLIVSVGTGSPSDVVLSSTNLTLNGVVQVTSFTYTITGGH